VHFETVDLSLLLEHKLAKLVDLIGGGESRRASNGSLSCAFLCVLLGRSLLGGLRLHIGR
jgi:hypothetical protein